MYFLFYVDLFTNFSSMVISALVFASVVCRPPDGSSVSPYRGHIKYYVYWRLFGLRVYRRLVGALLAPLTSCMSIRLITRRL